MKMLHIYRSEPSETTKKLVEIVSEGRESDSIDLNADTDYDALVDKVMAADQTICWWQQFMRVNKKGPREEASFCLCLFLTQPLDSH